MRDRTEYQRRYYVEVRKPTRPRTPPGPRACVQCGRVTIGTRRKMYCSDTCRKAAQRARKDT